MPVFVDVDRSTGNIDPVLVKAAVEDLQGGARPAQKWLPRQGVGKGWRLKGLLPVDVFGQPADMDPINHIASQHGLTVIEDACEALGAEYKGRLAGGLGNFGVYAFYPNKQITTGEGAMIVTDDDQAADLMKALRNQGRAPGDTWLQHTHLGYNYRLDEMSAALGRVQITRIEELLSKRERVAGWYAERLSEIPGVEAPAHGADDHTRELVRVRDPFFSRHRSRPGGAPTWASAASLPDLTSCRSTSSLTWWSASVTVPAISRLRRTWGGAGWRSPFRV